MFALYKRDMWGATDEELLANLLAIGDYKELLYLAAKYENHAIHFLRQGLIPDNELHLWTLPKIEVITEN